MMSTLVVAQLLFLEADNPKKEIAMYINSPGGVVERAASDRVGPARRSSGNPRRIRSLAERMLSTSKRVRSDITSRASDAMNFCATVGSRPSSDKQNRPWINED
jgi:hypothetical protein